MMKVTLSLWALVLDPHKERAGEGGLEGLSPASQLGAPPPPSENVCSVSKSFPKRWHLSAGFLLPAGL